MSFPLAKVAKFLDSGPEESTYFFAYYMAREADLIQVEIDVDK